MSDPIFVVPDEYPKFYGTYTDYFKLAGLCGFELCRRAEMRPDDASKTYIVTWFDVQHGGWPDAYARIILWNLEWASEVRPLDNVGYLTPDKLVPGVAEVWSPDAGFAAQQGWKYVPVMSHPNLALRPFSEPEHYVHDVTLQMYRGPARRQRVIEEMRKHGLSIALDAWGDGRHEAYINSRIQVHIHQHNQMNTVSPLRFAVAAAYKKPILSERITDSGVYKGLIVEVGYERIADAAKYYVNRPLSDLLEHGMKLHYHLCISSNFGDTVRGCL